MATSTAIVRRLAVLAGLALAAVSSLATLVLGRPASTTHSTNFDISQFIQGWVALATTRHTLRDHVAMAATWSARDLIYTT